MLKLYSKYNAKKTLPENYNDFAAKYRSFACPLPNWGAQHGNIYWVPAKIANEPLRCNEDTAPTRICWHGTILGQLTSNRIAVSGFFSLFTRKFPCERAKDPARSLNHGLGAHLFFGTIGRSEWILRYLKLSFLMERPSGQVGDISTVSTVIYRSHCVGLPIIISRRFLLKRTFFPFRVYPLYGVAPLPPIPLLTNIFAMFYAVWGTTGTGSSEFIMYFETATAARPIGLGPQTCSARLWLAWNWPSPHIWITVNLAWGRSKL